MHGHQKKHDIYIITAAPAVQKEARLYLFYNWITDNYESGSYAY